MRGATIPAERGVAGQNVHIRESERDAKLLIACSCRLDHLVLGVQLGLESRALTAAQQHDACTGVTWREGGGARVVQADTPEVFTCPAAMKE